jgi:hypothetical protein
MGTPAGLHKTSLWSFGTIISCFVSNSHFTPSRTFAQNFSVSQR